MVTGPHANRTTTSNTSSHPGSLFQFLLPKEIALANRTRRVLGRVDCTHTNKVACSSFHELINREKNLNEELLAEPSGDVAMKDRLKTQISDRDLPDSSDSPSLL